MKSEQRKFISVVDTYNKCQGKSKYRKVTYSELIAILIYSKIRSLDYKIVIKELSKIKINIRDQIRNSLLSISIEEIILIKDFLAQIIKETIIEIIQEFLAISLESLQNISFDEPDDDYHLFEESCIFFEKYQNQTSSVKSFINALSCLNSTTIPKIILKNLSLSTDIISLQDISNLTYFNDLLADEGSNLKISRKFIKLSSICLKSGSIRASLLIFFKSQEKNIDDLMILQVIQNFYFNYEVRNLALLKLMLRCCLLGMDKFNDINVMMSFIDELVSSFRMMINVYTSSSEDFENKVKVLIYIMRIFKK